MQDAGAILPLVIAPVTMFGSAAFSNHDLVSPDQNGDTCMKRYVTAATAALLVLGSAQPAWAGDVVLQPVPVGRETMRFDHGIVTLDLQGRGAAVQVTPRGQQHGSWVFDVAVLNTGTLPVNFSRDNISVATGTLPVALLTPQQLVHKAKKRAFWRAMAVAAVSGIAAGVMASQGASYKTRTNWSAGGSRGSFRSVTTGPSLFGQLQAAQLSQDSRFAIAAIQLQLDRTRQDIGDRAVELTTVDPGTSYGGQIVLDKLKPGALPQQVAITVAWNGEIFPFAFQLAPAGTPQQAFPTTIPLTSAAATPIPAVVPAAVPVAPEPMRVAAMAPAPSVAAVRAATARAAALAPVPVASVPVPSMPITALAVSAPVPVGGGLTEAERYQQRLAAARGVRGREARQGWTISD
jgi:hypothetical protein